MWVTTFALQGGQNLSSLGKIINEYEFRLNGMNSCRRNNPQYQTATKERETVSGSDFFMTICVIPKIGTILIHL